MTPRRPSLPAMQAFRRVVEQQSFGAAARSLEITGGAVSKLVAQLEHDLGVRLLHRTTRSVSVSAEGQAFYRDAVRILDEVDAAAEAVRSGAAAPGGRLRVSLPTSFALAWLAARLPAFMRAHPQIELDLALNDRYVDIVQEGFDCAIRIATHLPDSTLVARRLGVVQRLLVAAPSYLDVAPPLAKPQDLGLHACLVYSQDGGPAEWSLQGAAPLRTSGYCRVNNSVMLPSCCSPAWDDADAGFRRRRPPGLWPAGGVAACASAGAARCVRRRLTPAPRVEEGGRVPGLRRQPAVAATQFDGHLKCGKHGAEPEARWLRPGG